MQMRALLLLLCCSALSAGQQAAPAKRLVCYYTSWARYRPPLASFTPQNINPYLCTHLHYFLANTNEQQMLGPADPYSDFTLKGYEQIVALKKVNPALKVLLALGGSYGTQQQAFGEIIADDEKIKRFTTESIKYMRKHNFDGIEIDWRVPGQRAGRTKLLRELAAAFREESKASEKEKLLLSTSISGNTTRMTEDFDIPQISGSVDYINGLTFQFHSGEQNVTGHHSPLFAIDPDDTESLDSTVQMYIRMGGDLAKLNLAVPTFGKTFTLSNPDVHGFGAPAKDVGFAGKLTRSAGALSFTEICEQISMNGWKAIRPFKDAVGPYAVKGDQWVAYDDEFMMRRKGAYVREKGLGGAAVWSLDQDDFRGFCTGRRFPLIEALKMGLFEDGQVTTTTPIPPTTPIYDNAKIFGCSGNGRFPKQDDCTTFYVCTNGRIEEKTCEDGTKYNATEGFCSETASCEEEQPPPLTGFQPTPPPATPTSPTMSTTTPPPATSAHYH